MYATYESYCFICICYISIMIIRIIHKLYVCMWDHVYTGTFQTGVPERWRCVLVLQLLQRFKGYTMEYDYYLFFANIFLNLLYLEEHWFFHNSTIWPPTTATSELLLRQLLRQRVAGGIATNSYDYYSVMTTSTTTTSTATSTVACWFCYSSSATTPPSATNY